MTGKFLFLFILALGFSTAACSRSGESAAAGGRSSSSAPVRMLFPVEVAPVSLRTVTYTVNAVGSVMAYETVQVTSRVSGVVEAVRFTEGDRRTAGATLVEIEPLRYRLALDSARAMLQKAMAAQADAKAGLQRREAVVARSPGLIPEEEIEVWRTKVQTTAAEVELAKTSLNQAKLNLDDALVKAPVGGVIQTRSVQTGQYVQPGTILATLLRRDPLLLRFNVPEAEAAQMKPGMKANFRVASKSAHEARITLVADAADESSRLVHVTAEVIDRRASELRPGSFAEVSVPVGGNHEIPVIPQTAIRPSERGFISFVIENGQAQERILTLGMRTDDGQVAVLDGVKPGEILVVRGGEALKTGYPVRIVPRGGKSGAGQKQSASDQKPADRPH